MKILVRKALIVDPQSAFNGTQKDILIDDTKIVAIEDSIHQSADQIIDHTSMMVSPGWVDTFSHFCDPGFEYKETIESGVATATAGGYTKVFILPNTQPLIQSKAQVEYVVQKARYLSTQVYPIGAITKNIEGKDLAEMYDMQSSGAAAFTDGLHPVQTSGLLLKALQYVKAFNGVIVQMPIDKSIGTYGLMNEGVISTQMGMQGIPAIGEEIIIKRDIDLLRYTESKLCLTGVSTAKGIELIAAAKKEGLQIFCSVTPYHLFFNEEDLHDYNTNLKVNPPLRSKADMLALRNAVMDGTVDMIASHHFPQDWDKKACEFEYAGNGMIGLQTCYAIVNEVLPQLNNERLTELFSTNARNIFGLNNVSVNVGNNAELSLFSKTGTTVLEKQNSKSKSFNSPFMNRSLNGKVIGIINNGNAFLN